MGIIDESVSFNPIKMFNYLKYLHGTWSTTDLFFNRIRHKVKLYSHVDKIWDLNNLHLEDDAGKNRFGERLKWWDVATCRTLSKY